MFPSSSQADDATEKGGGGRGEELGMRLLCLL